MASGSTIHGAQVPSPKWWRPFRNAPLIVVAILSVAAAIVGWTTTYQLNAAAAQPAPIAPSPGASAIPADVAAPCRAPLAAPDGEPWIDDRDRATQVWNDNAEALAGPVVMGRDGWAFYNDQVEENFSQTIGRRYLTQQEVDAWHSYFASIAEGLAAEGVELTIQVTPSAGSVYPEQLPEWTDDIRGSTALDQLLVASPDLPIVDFREDLRAASEDNAVYSPVNSHWTDWGGYIGWQTFAACDAALYPDSPAIVVPPSSGIQLAGPYNEYGSYGVPDPTSPDWTVPIFTGPLPDVEVTDNSGATTAVTGQTALDLSRLPASTATADSYGDRTALIVRDSMGNALSPYWQQEYAQTWQIQHRYDDWSNPPNYKALVDQYHPDVVIIQLAERHLANAPAPAINSGY